MLNSGISGLLLNLRCMNLAVQYYWYRLVALEFDPLSFDKEHRLGISLLTVCYAVAFARIDILGFLYLDYLRAWFFTPYVLLPIDTPFFSERWPLSLTRMRRGFGKP